MGYVLLCTTPAAAQDATLRGFVTDASDGRPLELANVVVIDDAGVRGAATDQDGLYVLRGIAPGSYLLRVSALGYETSEDSLQLAPGDVRTVNLDLAPTDVQLDEVFVEAERTGGAARTTAGHQVVRPQDVELIPMPDVAGDLVGYLSVQPGVVTSGDRGGQMYVRGGEPTQNLIYFDGIPLVQPFHVFGSYSAFPADVIQRADVYAAGFGSRFTGRLSAVIDVASRPGNNRRFAGQVGVSPFLSSARLEGPIVPGNASFLVSVRESLMEDVGERFAQDELPYRFGDAFGRISASVTGNSRVTVSALRTHDRGRLVEPRGGLPQEDVRWINEGVGMRYLVLPSVIPVVLDLQLAHSRFETELGRLDDPERWSQVRNTRVAIEASFMGEAVDVSAGWQLDVLRLRSELGGLYQDAFAQATALSPSGFYVEPDVRLGSNFFIRPGARLQFYGVQFDPFIEPRLQVRWEAGMHQVSGAVGLYHQEVLGLNDRRDAASIFTVWTRIPREGTSEDDLRSGRLGRSIHGVLGYRTMPAAWLDWSIEGFYKHTSNLFIGEWTPYPRFTTNLQPASGRSFGVETRLELRRGPFTTFVNYGLSATRYEARQPSLAIWYGTESLSFRPPHDRRHQVNLVASAAWGEWEVAGRLEFGSGLPFSRAVGFDGFALIDDIVDVAEIPRSRRVIYEEPYRGVLPAYHRVDVSAQRSFDLGAADLTLQASVLNVFDRQNVFYLDVFTLRRVDQIPVVPTFGMQLSFE